MITYIYSPEFIKASVADGSTITDKSTEIRIYYQVKRTMVNELGQKRETGYATSLDGCKIVVEGNADYTRTTFNPYDNLVCLYVNVFQSFEYENGDITVTVIGNDETSDVKPFTVIQAGTTEEFMQYYKDDKTECSDQSGNWNFSYDDAEASGGTLCPHINYSVELGGVKYEYSTDDCKTSNTKGNIDILFICCELSIINNKNGIVKVPSKKNIISDRTKVGNVQAFVYINGRLYETLCTDVYQKKNEIVREDSQKEYLELYKNISKIPKGGTNGGLIVSAVTYHDTIIEYTSGYKDMVTKASNAASFSSDSSSQIITFSANRTHEIDNKMVAVNVPKIQPNQTDKDRTIKITAKNGGLSKTVSVVQRGVYAQGEEPPVDPDEPEEPEKDPQFKEYKYGPFHIDFYYKHPDDANKNVIPASGTNGKASVPVIEGITFQVWPVYEMADGTLFEDYEKRKRISIDDDPDIVSDIKLILSTNPEPVEDVEFDTKNWNIIKNSSNEEADEIIICEVRLEATVTNKKNGQELDFEDTMPVTAQIKQPSNLKKKVFREPVIGISYPYDAGRDGGKDKFTEPYVDYFWQTYYYEGSEDTSYNEFYYGIVEDPNYKPIKFSEFPWPDSVDRSSLKFSCNNLSGSVTLDLSNGKIWAAYPNNETTRYLLGKPIFLECIANGVKGKSSGTEAYQEAKEYQKIGFKFAETNPAQFEVGKNGSMQKLNLSVVPTDDEEYLLATDVLGKLENGSFIMLRLWNYETRIYAPDKFCAYNSESWLGATFTFEFDKDIDLNELGTGNMWYTAYVCDDETGKNFSPVTYKNGYQTFGEIKFILPEKIDITVNNFNNSSLQILDNGSPGRTAKSKNVSILSDSFTLRYDGTVSVNEISGGRNAFMEFTDATAYPSNVYFNTEGKGYMIFQNLSFVNKSPAFVMSNLNTWIYFEWYSEKYGNKTICCRAPLFKCKYNGSTIISQEWTLAGDEENGVPSNSVSQYWMVIAKDMPDVTAISGNGALPKIVMMRMQTFSQSDGLYVNLTDSVMIKIRNYNGNTNYTTVS